MSIPKELQSVFNLSNEPGRLVKEAEVHRLLTENPAGFVAYAVARLKGIASGDIQLEQPAKLLFDDAPGEGDFRVMPCVTRSSGEVVKTVKIVGTNIRQETVPGQITVGKAFALHPVENFITHTFDACLLSSARTGLCAALGIRQLLESPASVSLAGCGRVGFYSLLYTQALYPLERVTLWDADPARAQALAQALQTWLPEVTVECLPEPEFEGEALILATSSREPVSAPENTQARLIVSLGADTDDQHELDDRWAANAAVFVDTMDTLNFGDLKGWLNKGWLQRDKVTDLFALLGEPEPGREGRQEQAVSGRGQPLYVSTGSALFDNLAIGYLLQRL